MGKQALLTDIELGVSADPGLPTLISDARRLEQILVNLIENAAHAVRSGTEPRIELCAVRSSDGIGLVVRDNGPGIDPDAQPHIFDPFFTTKDPGEGTGLGLWNGHRLAQILGGRLEVESVPGRTTFSLLLPVADTNTGHVSLRTDHR